MYPFSTEYGKELDNIMFMNEKVLYKEAIRYIRSKWGKRKKRISG